MRLHAHFGMLPLGAFEHCGDKRIKPQGGGGFVGDIVDTVGDVVGDVVDFGGDVIESVGDAGSWIDDKVNEEIPGGWYTVAAVTGATMGGLPVTGTEAGAAGGTSGAAGSGFGLNPASTGGFGLSTSTAGTGINAGALGGMEWLGGAGTLPVGTAGLTASQIANAGMAGQVGSNAASGLGYLGGASSLPSGTAGITGVTATPFLDSVTNFGKSLLGNQQPSSNAGSGMNLLAKGLSPQQQDMPIGYNMNRSPFAYTQATPIQSVDPLKNLADLLRKS